MNWEDTIVEAAATDTGMRRSNNQDSHCIVRAPSPAAWRERGHVYMVADGMGAHAVGELASKMACDNIPHNYKKTKNLAASEAVVKAYREVGAQIHGRATANKEFQGMGTTCSSLILLPEGALIAHVGDSRVYRVRQEQVSQLTFDHSLVWELVRRNHLAFEQAQKAVPRNVITRSLGPDPTVEVDLEGPYPVEPGDVYLLCSDGLSGPISDPELGAFAFNFHPENACRYLVHLANLRGGMDNITCIILRVGEWVEPGHDPAPEQANNHKSKESGGKGFRLSSLLTGLSRKAAKAPPEEHLYRSAACPIDEPLLRRLGDDIRHGRALAVEQSWPIDWPVFANLVRASDEARSEGDLRGVLRCFGEAIVMLGTAGRLHRKEQGNGAHH